MICYMIHLLVCEILNLPRAAYPLAYRIRRVQAAEA